MAPFKNFFNKSDSNKRRNSNEVVYESKLPDYIDAANKIYNKEYDAALVELKQQLENANPNDIENLSMIHINLMQAYFKNRSNAEYYFALSTHHAKEALKFGHNTGLAAFRIIANLEKERKFKQAIEVCQVVTSKDYHFSKFGYKQKPEFHERMAKLKLKLEKYGDDSSDSFLTDQEKALIIKNSQRGK